MKNSFAHIPRTNGELELPGDKSISHRALIFSALANGTSEITSLANSDDVNSTLNCLKDLNVEIIKNNDSVLVKGVGRKGELKIE